MNALIGVDIGTQGTKAAAFDQDGTLLAVAFRKSVLHQPAPGIVEENPERQLQSVCQAIRACVAQARLAPTGVAAIALDGQMAGILGVGRDGRHVTPYDSWLDTRCAPYITRMTQVAGEEVMAKTGGPPSFNHGPKILWWMHERPAVYRSIQAFVQPAGYAVMRLCGLPARDAFVDRTYLHFSGFADNPNATWDQALCRQFKLDTEKLPRIVKPHDIVGELADHMARRCGLRRGVPVVAGCGDTAASFLACGATRPGICVDVAGTASVFAATTRVFSPDRRRQILSCGQAATPGLWHPYAYINGGGLNLEWFREHIAASPRNPRPTLQTLDRAAARLAPLPTLPFFIPHLGGRVAPSWPDLRGAWAGLNWNHRPAHLWRAMLEAVALEYALYRQALLSLYPHLRLAELRVTGGGEKSLLWNQIKADVLNTPVVQIARSEGAPLGAALLAAYGVGLIANLETGAQQWIRTARRTLPNRRLAGFYRDRLNRYEQLLGLLKQWR